MNGLNQSNMNSTFKLVVLISGRGSNLKSLLESFNSGNSHYPISVIGVISNKADAYGLEIAKSFGVQGIFLDPKGLSKEDYDRLLVEQINNLAPDLIVLAGYMKILTPIFIKSFAGKIINIHPSLLPAFPGLNVQQAAIDAGASESGCTVHYVVEEVDAGPIIGQRAVPIYQDDTKESLSERILKEEHILLPECIIKIFESKSTL